MSNSEVKSRVFGLDVLRSIAILVVVEQHGRNLINWRIFPWTDGVDIFFVLSGFLIGQILIKIYQKTSNFSTSDIKTFWMRRWFRTLPNYILAFIINIPVFMFFYNLPFSEVPFSYLFFMQNFSYPIIDIRFFSESWSLSIEEWFYILSPILLFIFSKFKFIKNSKLSLPFTIASLLFIPLILRIFLSSKASSTDLESWNNNFRTIVLTRLDSIGYGVLGAYIKSNFKELWSNEKFKKGTLTLGLILCIIFDRTNIFNGFIKYGFFTDTFYFSLFPLSVLLCFPFFDSWRIPIGSTNPFHKAINFISQISYSMYLFHNSLFIIPVSQMVLHEGRLVKLALYPVYWIFVLGFSAFVYKYFEKPFLDYRDKKYKQ